jgi:hypothetical protein
MIFLTATGRKIPDGNVARLPSEATFVSALARPEWLAEVDVTAATHESE